MPSSSSSSSLPTPQQLLTSLLDTIAAIPAPDAAETRHQQEATKSQTSRTVGGISKRAGPPPPNPLKSLSPSHRNYFLTLHVLFPSLLLPALDLLDRGLVARLSLPRAQDDDDDVGGEAGGGEEGREGEDMLMMTDDDRPPRPPSPRTSQVYHVRSAVQKKTHHHHSSTKRGGRGAEDTSLGGEGGGSSVVQNNSNNNASSFYIVHTAVWNCTCAAFAFAAFPPPPPPLPPPPDNNMTVDQDAAATASDIFIPRVTAAADSGEDEMIDETPRFGGLNFLNEDDDDVGGGRGTPPCCKHLLACVLAERWDTVLGQYVIQRSVTREEMAGIFADI